MNQHTWVAGWRYSDSQQVAVEPLDAVQRLHIVPGYATLEFMNGSVLLCNPPTIPGVMKR